MGFEIPEETKHIEQLILIWPSRNLTNYRTFDIDDVDTIVSLFSIQGIERYKKLASEHHSQKQEILRLERLVRLLKNNMGVSQAAKLEENEANNNGRRQNRNKVVISTSGLFSKPKRKSRKTR